LGRINAILRLNMSGHAVDGRAEAERYGAALDMAAYADESGFAVVNVEEHHDAAIGWLPSPLVMAALIIARTSRVQVRASALLGPLYDPIRLAEDIAILDLASRGRFSFVLGRATDRRNTTRSIAIGRDVARRPNASSRPCSPPGVATRSSIADAWSTSPRGHIPNRIRGSTWAG
jgi:alkanesulfonate monooxygenase SsuD/methylene tetrahydromethanopterin reductase-like flavin-dependent oxidoreductase (luciferase family)